MIRLTKPDQPDVVLEKFYTKFYRSIPKIIFQPILEMLRQFKLTRVKLSIVPNYQKQTKIRLACIPICVVQLFSG